MSGIRRRLFLAGSALLACAAAVALVAPWGSTTGRPGLDERVRAVSSTLRCPVCKDLSVADSPAAIAQRMRATVRRDLAAGMTPDRIRTYFVRRYGRSVLMAPPKRGLNLLIWLLPAVAAGCGAALLAMALRRWLRAQPPERSARVDPAAAELALTKLREGS
jgi:cytochrome c-type biogenesis protein CcmH